MARGSSQEGHKHHTGDGNGTGSLARSTLSSGRAACSCCRRCCRRRRRLCRCVNCLDHVRRSSCRYSRWSLCRHSVNNSGDGRHRSPASGPRYRPCQYRAARSHPGSAGWRRRRRSLYSALESVVGSGSLQKGYRVLATVVQPVTAAENHTARRQTHGVEGESRVSVKLHVATRALYF